MTMKKTLTLEELWELQDLLMKKVESGTLIEDILHDYSICTKCRGVSTESRDGCSCDDEKGRVGGD